MRDRRDTVFPVPEGISSTAFPPASSVSRYALMGKLPICESQLTFEITHVA